MPLLDRGSWSLSRQGLPESCVVGCQAGFSNHHEFADLCTADSGQFNLSDGRNSVDWFRKEGAVLLTFC